MRTRKFFNTPDDPDTGDGADTTANSGDAPPSDDPGRTDTDTVPKKKPE